MNKVELYTERLVLRLVKLSDLEAIHELHSFPETDRYNTLGIPKNIEETASIIESWTFENQKETIKNYTFVIETKTSNQFIGIMGFKLGNKKFRKAEVWYKLNPNHWGNGYATESLNLVISFGFDDLNLHRIEAGCAIENIASIKLLEKVGMIREGQKRAVLPLKSGWSDNYEYAIIKTDPREN